MGEDRCWRRARAEILPLNGHLCVATRIRDADKLMETGEDMLVCFGGMSDSDPTAVHNDIWFFDCFSRKWLPQPPSAAGLPRSGAASEQDPTLFPSARYAHLSAVSRGRLVISGGQHSDNS